MPEAPSRKLLTGEQNTVVKVVPAQSSRTLAFLVLRVAPSSSQPPTYARPSQISLVVTAESADKLSYSTRPLWDEASGPRQILPHLSAPSVPSDDLAACQRHSWEPRNKTHILWDATLLNTELDMLEIRLVELWSVVDMFLVLESTHSMTGSPKNLYYSQNRSRFDQWSSKIKYRTYQGRPMQQGDGPFTLANEQRQGVTAFMWVNSLHPSDDVLVLMADVDEVPYESALRLLKACTAPLPIHLQLQNYLYSFEYPTLADSWRAQVHLWSEARTFGGYRHGQSSEIMLASSGWHCSFCFPTLSEFAVKMLSSSHLDRLLKRPNFSILLSLKEIQKKICRGQDLYGMLPEAYRWSDLFKLWQGARKEVGNVNLPRAVISNPTRFSYLLPHGCVREQGPLT
ncbi:hypothetical protein CBS101457_003010 [Exobasidium rhododendri]|nr:hypothetical protein CBS101457_003010 [Exobasidium rhododendri]